MRKIFTASIIIMLLSSANVFAGVDPDPEIHRVIGGLYSLVSAITLNGDTAPDIRALRKYFADVPNDWPGSVRIEKVGNDIWAGVSVGKMSTARKYLRSNSPKLGITDSPAGDSWMGGSFAWLKAGSISGGKLIPSSLRAAQADGTIFFSVNDSDWWMSYPEFSRTSAGEIMKLCGVMQEGLSRPKGAERRSIYDEVRPSAVRKPADIRTSRKHAFGESYDVNMGDVIFQPIRTPTYTDSNRD